MAARWLARLHRLEDALLAAMLLALLLLAGLQIGLRLLFDSGLIWAEAVSRLGVLWLALFVVSVLTMAGVGYFCGLSRSRRTPEVLVLALSFSAILVLVADLDRPLEGFVRVSQQAMIDVREMMDAMP